MSSKMRLWPVHLLLLLFHPLRCSAKTICPDHEYLLGGLANEYCYQYYAIAEDYSAANRSCVRDGGVLVYIDDSNEDNYLYQTFFISRGKANFWIGLNDMATEGIFRWEKKNSAESSTLPSYYNWTAGSPVGNSVARDCVKYTGNGWQVHEGYCTTSSLPHVCKMRSCASNDGRYCIGAEPTAAAPRVPPVAIAVPIMVVIMLALLVGGVALILVCLWKHNKELLQSCFCCSRLLGNSKNAIHSMQQENQRLRHELSQHKVSLSGRFQTGQFLGAERVLSGVPDGQGGMLPTIKQPVPSGRGVFPPMTTGPTGVPPLVLQQSTTPAHAFIRRTQHHSLSSLSHTAPSPLQSGLSPFQMNMDSLPARSSLSHPVSHEPLEVRASSSSGSSSSSWSNSEQLEHNGGLGTTQ